MIRCTRCGRGGRDVPCDECREFDEAIRQRDELRRLADAVRAYRAELHDDGFTDDDHRFMARPSLWRVFKTLADCDRLLGRSKEADH